MEPIKIYPKALLNLQQPLLLGRPNGEKLTAIINSKLSGWDYLEKHHDKIIIVCDFIEGMNKSFFLGAFGQRVKILGAEKFREKYVFNCIATIKSDIDNEFIPASLLDFPITSTN